VRMRFPLTFSRHRPAAGALPLGVASPAPGYFAEQSLIFSNTPLFLIAIIFAYSPSIFTNNTLFEIAIMDCDPIIYKDPYIFYKLPHGICQAYAYKPERPPTRRWTCARQHGLRHSAAYALSRPPVRCSA
jgi:hypothetical protein